MTREKAIEFVKEAFVAWESEYRVPHEDWTEIHKARDIAIEALSADTVSREVYDKRTQADEKIIDSYRQEFQRALSADAVQKWIPVSERLPKYRQTVLISTKWKVTVAYRDSINEGVTDDFWDCPLDDSTIDTIYITAWMPLPEPYKNNDDNEDYKRAIDQLEHNILYESTFNPEDGSM